MLCFLFSLAFGRKGASGVWHLGQLGGRRADSCGRGVDHRAPDTGQCPPPLPDSSFCFGACKRFSKCVPTMGAPSSPPREALTRNLIRSPSYLVPATPWTRRALGGRWTPCCPLPGEQARLLGMLCRGSQERGERGGVTVGRSLGEIRSFPKYLPSQRSSQSTARTSRWGTAGSGWSGCARP